MSFALCIYPSQILERFMFLGDVNRFLKKYSFFITEEKKSARIRNHEV